MAEVDIADANRVRVSYVEETSFGETPVSPTLIDVRLISESFAQNQTTEDSKEIRDDRQISDIVRTKVSGSGDIGIELSYGAHDDLLCAMLMATAWSSPVTIGPIATISVSSVDNSFNDSGAGFGTLAINQWIKTSAFATAGNNSYFKIVSKTTTKIIVKGGTLVTEAAAAAGKIIMGAQIINGITKKSYTIERQYTDLTNLFVAYKGCMVNTGHMDVKADAIITGGFGFLGKREIPGTATVGVGYTAAPSNDVMAGVSDVFAVFHGVGSLLTTLTDVSNFSFSYNNNLRERLRVGTLGAFSIGTGTIGLDGALTSYFYSTAMIQEYLDFSECALAVGLTDADANTYIVDMPSVKFSDGKRAAGGINTDIMADMKFRAKRNPTEGITCRIARFPGP